MSQKNSNDDIQKILDEIAAKHRDEMDAEDFEHKMGMCEAVWMRETAILLTDSGWMAFGSTIDKAIVIFHAMRFDTFKTLLAMAISLTKGMSDYREALENEDEDEDE